MFRNETLKRKHVSYPIETKIETNFIFRIKSVHLETKFWNERWFISDRNEIWNEKWISYLIKTISRISNQLCFQFSQIFHSFPRKTNSALLSVSETLGAVGYCSGGSSELRPDTRRNS